MRKLLDVIPRATKTGAKHYAAIYGAIFLGSRRAEICDLRVQDLVLDQHADGTPKLVARFREKGDKERMHEIPPPVYEGITAALDAAGRSVATLRPSDRLFGMAPNTLYAAVVKYATRAGIGHVHVHTLRHTAAKLRRRIGYTPEQVMNYLGHSDLGVTTTYLRDTEGDSDPGWRTLKELLQR